MSEAFSLKYLVLLGAVSAMTAGFYVGLLTLFAPDYAERSELYNNSVEEIGFGFAIALMLIGVFAISLSAKIMLAQLAKTEPRVPEPRATETRATDKRD